MQESDNLEELDGLRGRRLESSVENCWTSITSKELELDIYIRVSLVEASFHNSWFRKIARG